MMDEALLRLGVFTLALGILLGAEKYWPRRPRKLDVLRRWPANFGVALIGTVAMRVLVPASAASVAILADNAGTGLLNWVSLPFGISVVLAFIGLDLTVYLQHRLFHRIPVLWRLHRMHHMDLEIDASTGLRFHPFELLLSLLIKLGAVALLGAPVAAVILFEIVLNASAMFNHANLRLPQPVDDWLRWLVVTPDMHRVHHSTIPRETNSNFGFFLSCWDRWLGSYTAQPQLGHTQMEIGLREYRGSEAIRIDRMLTNPFTPTAPKR